MSESDRSPGSTAGTAMWAAALVTVLAPCAAAVAAQEVIVELPAQDRLLHADFEDVYRLGTLEGDGWEAFGRVAGVGFDRDGNLYVLDTDAVRIYVVDRQGSLVRRFIGEGEGPGEFGGNYAASLEFAVLSDGRVTVYDTGRLGFALFGVDGEFDRAIPLAGAHTHFPLLGGIQAFPGMDRVISTTEVSHLGRTAPNPEDAPSPAFRHVLSYDLSGAQIDVDTVAAGWMPPVDLDRSVVFRPRLRAGVLPGGAVAYTDSSAYAIKLVAPGGRATLILTRPFRPRPVTDRVRAAEIERRLEELEQRGTGGDPFQDALIEYEREQLESIEFYHEMPVVLALRTSWEGTIWVRRRGEEGAGRDPIDLITADGRYLGTFAPGATGLPSAFGPDGLAAFLETDEMDVPYVVVKRLPAGLR